MAQVIERGRGYYSDFRIGRKRIRRFLNTDKREAQIELGRLMEKMRSTSMGRPSQNISWDDFVAKYLATRESKKPATLKRDTIATDIYKREMKPESLSQFNPEAMEQYKGKRVKRGRAASSINREIGSLKTLAHTAEAWGYMDPKPWSSVKRIKEARRKLYFHTPKDLSKLLGFCNGVWKTICLLGSRAGLRREEIRMLAWEDVNFVRGRVHVVGKDGWNPKDYEERFIPMVPDLADYLRNLKRTSEWVISDETGERPSLAVMSSYFRKLADKAELRGSIHILRHTFASHLVQNGESLKKVKDLLGHSNMKTTEIYAQLTGEETISLPPIPS